MIDIVALQRKTERYEFADGIRDFQMAIWMVIFGFYAWLVFDLPTDWMRPVVELARSQGSLFALLIIFTLAIGIPVIIVQGGMELVNRYVRPRWLWRNTGFVMAKRWVVSRSMLFVAFAIMLITFVAGTLLAMRLNDFWIIFRGISVGTGLELTFMYWMLGARLQITRYYVIAAVGLLGTVVIMLLPITAGMTGFVTGLFWAVVLTVSGVYALRDVMLQQEVTADAA